MNNSNGFDLEKWDAYKTIAIDLICAALRKRLLAMVKTPRHMGVLFESYKVCTLIDHCPFRSEHCKYSGCRASFEEFFANKEDTNETK